MSNEIRTLSNETQDLSAKMRFLNAQLREMDFQLKSLQNPLTSGDHEELGRIQSRYDAVAAMRGERAPLPRTGEGPLAYRRRMAGEFLKHSQFRESNFALADNPTLDAVEPKILEAVRDSAASSALRKDGGGIGHLIPHQTTDPAGRTITKWFGDPLNWMQHFTGPGAVGRFEKPTAFR